MPISTYLALHLMNHVLGGGDYSRPATIYIALSTANPTGDASGIAEPSGNNYSRVAVTDNTTNFPSANPKLNGTEIDFPTPSGGWGTITHFALFDAATSGNMLFYGALTASKTVNNGDPIGFAVGVMSLSFASS